VNENAEGPVCGMVVDEETAIKRKIGDRTYYFCSEPVRKPMRRQQKKNAK